MAEPAIEKKAKKKKEKPEGKKLEPDQILKSEKGAEYLVERLLGVGGFGEVWKISLLKDPERQFAMKTEPNHCERKNMLRLKAEVNLFEEIDRAPSQCDKSHFVKMHDKGKTVDFKYYIMDLIWLSLREIKEKICGDVFTPHTKIKTARQTLKAIESLHEIGFLHRDIKPANYAVGLPPKDNMVYLLDFGIARPYRDKDGGVRKARKRVPYMGTLLYASMEGLVQNEQARRDDLEVWMYMMLEFYDRSNLLWANVDKEEVQLHVDLRTELMTKPRELHAAGKLKAPEKWCDIIELLNGMEYEEVGDYTKINLLLSQICVDENIDENLQLDWVGKKPKSPERPKREVKKKEKKEKHRRRVTDGDDSKSGDGSEVENSDDYEAYLKWKKNRKKNRKKPSNDRGSNDHSDRKNLPRKKASTEKKKDENGENDVGSEKEEKGTGSKKKGEDKKIGTMKKSEGTPESNESNNERMDKEKIEKEKKRVQKKRGHRTPDSNEDDKEDKGIQTKRAGAVRKKETNLVENKKNERKRPTKRKSQDRESLEDKDKVERKDLFVRKNDKPVEKLPATRNATPELKRANDVAHFKKGDDKKK